MTGRTSKARRWRPRFSVRTLVILVTLVCCYAACWKVTKTCGVHVVMEHARNPYLMKNGVEFRLGGGWRDYRKPMTPVAFVVSVARYDPTIIDAKGDGHLSSFNRPGREYYFWFFGYVAKLPYERPIAP